MTGCASDFWVPRAAVFLVFPCGWTVHARCARSADCEGGVCVVWAHPHGDPRVRVSSLTGMRLGHVRSRDMLCVRVGTCGGLRPDLLMQADGAACAFVQAFPSGAGPGYLETCQGDILVARFGRLGLPVALSSFCGFFRDGRPRISGSGPGLPKLSAVREAGLLMGALALPLKTPAQPPWH